MKDASKKVASYMVRAVLMLLLRHTSGLLVEFMLPVLKCGFNHRSSRNDNVIQYVLLNNLHEIWTDSLPLHSAIFVA